MHEVRLKTQAQMVHKVLEIEKQVECFSFLGMHKTKCPLTEVMT